jgi:hypothetical protein
MRAANSHCKIRSRHQLNCALTGFCAWTSIFSIESIRPIGKNDLLHFGAAKVQRVSPISLYKMYFAQ